MLGPKLKRVKNQSGLSCTKKKATNKQAKNKQKTTNKSMTTVFNVY